MRDSASWQVLVNASSAHDCELGIALQELHCVKIVPRDSGPSTGLCLRKLRGRQVSKSQWRVIVHDSKRGLLQ